MLYSKCRQYAPSEKIKGPEKPSNPKSGIVFNPSTVVSIVTEPDGPEAHVNRDEILRQFIEVGICVVSGLYVCALCRLCS